MATLVLNTLPETAITRLDALAAHQGLTAAQLAAALIEQYLEDQEDIADALTALNDGETPITWAKVKEELGL